MERVDGCSLLTSGLITYMTVPLQLSIEPEHQELISFNLVSSPQFPVILGLPWLSVYNPTVDWQARNLAFSSEHCQLHCLKKDIPPTVIGVTLTNLERLPPPVPKL